MARAPLPSCKFPMFDFGLDLNLFGHAIGRRAIKKGATKEEIVEALRVAYSIGGNEALFKSALVLQALFKQT